MILDRFGDDSGMIQDDFCDAARSPDLENQGVRVDGLHFWGKIERGAKKTHTNYELGSQKPTKINQNSMPRGSPS